MLMATVTESFDRFMIRFVRRTVLRLLADEDIHVPPEVRELGRKDQLLAQIRMAVHLRTAVNQYIEERIVFGGDPADVLLADIPAFKRVTDTNPRQRTWQEFGEALGVSAQAAHRKYARAGQIVS
jgi:hypothetical protein